MRIATLVVLGAAAATTTAHAGGDQDAAGAVREALARGTRGDAKLPHVLVKADAKVAAAAGGPLMLDGQATEPASALVFGRADKSHLIALDTGSVRLMLWAPEDQLVAVVAHEAGLATTESGPAPAAGGDGFFVEPGAIPAGPPKGDRVHIVVSLQEQKIDGWIAAGALAFEFVPDHLGAGWKPAIYGSQILVGGAAIVTSDGDVMVHKLAKGRGELGEVGWRARGTLVVAKPLPPDGGTRDAMGPTPRLIPAKDAVAMPLGACLYDSAGNLVGVITARNATFAKVVGDHLETNIDSPLGGAYLAVRTHGTGKAVERCTK